MCRVMSRHFNAMIQASCPEIIKALFSQYSFFHYFDSLAMGCLAAVCLARNEAWILAIFNRFKWKITMLAVALILVPHVLAKFDVYYVRMFTIPLGPTFQACGFAILLLQSIFAPAAYKPLNWPVIRNLGILSYSIYIWQMIFCANPARFGTAPKWFLSFPGWLLATAVTAIISYYFLEKPLMRLRARLRPA
jgi:peptidoglycan/LPS O-acetylase OafA/YrhL